MVGPGEQFLAQRHQFDLPPQPPIFHVGPPALAAAGFGGGQEQIVRRGDVFDRAAPSELALIHG
jgi:hypothetical protein